MKQKFLWLWGFILISCSETTIQGFDSQSWKSDRMGCRGLRMQLLSHFQAHKEKFLNLSEKQLLDILGKPDKIELAQRNQRFFYYFVEKGSQCDSSFSRPGRHVVIRINSIEIVNEINIPPL
ncbi:MAG: hypothetical protein NZM38_02225 [Cytophagales bacterium]|nr:hypothetical protein [Cytophagales bacterium]MDW8383569.1 hypothetical protein [Flammeovirgaceae bacterium]